jgi:hypothetical protein
VTEEKPEPYPVGSVVDYRGSHSHGRYVITAHGDPVSLFSPLETEVLNARYPRGLDEVYPDGVCYEIWRQGVLRRFGNRMYAVYRVRRRSLIPTGEMETPESSLSVENEEGQSQQSGG